MRGWLARATASTIRRGEGDTRVARWSRWLPDSSPAGDGLFQGSSDPFPGHWQESPRPWPPGFAAEPPSREQLRRALEELPASWREVVCSRDLAGGDGAEAAARLGLSAGQERQILNRARAALRGALCRLPGQGAR